MSSDNKPNVGGGNPSNEMLLKSMRGMAWEEAKGKLQAVLQTYWMCDPMFEPMDVAIKEFVQTVQDNGWVE